MDPLTLLATVVQALSMLIALVKSARSTVAWAIRYQHRPRRRSRALHATVAMKPSLEVKVMRQGQPPVTYCPD